MKHVQHISSSDSKLPDSFVIKATGRYYTDWGVAKRMADSLVGVLASSNGKQLPQLRIADPFAGDGRLIIQFIHAWHESGGPRTAWDITLWDLNEEGLKTAESELSQLKNELGSDLNWTCTVGDTFQMANLNDPRFDVVLTNPPWELLKPDRRELKHLSEDLAASYIAAMREYDDFLASNYPTAQPSRKFAGWGTNLSRVGLDVCRKILRDRGVLGIVMPASFMADDLSTGLRREILESYTVHEIAYYPAEARLYGSADVATITVVAAADPQDRSATSLSLVHYDKDLAVTSRQTLDLNQSFLQSCGYVIPVSVRGDAMALLRRLSETLPTWGDLEGNGPSSLWAGREVDETGIRNWLSPDQDGLLFYKGRMIDRFTIRTMPTDRLVKLNWSPPASTEFNRIAWRDVSRPNQKRRVIATVIPSGSVAGNSLGIAFFRDENEVALHSLLGVMSSLTFEFLLRGHLATGHISLSSLRKVRVPSHDQLISLSAVAEETRAILDEPRRDQARLEALVAFHAYKLREPELDTVLSAFDKLTENEKVRVKQEYLRLKKAPAPSSRVNRAHFEARSNRDEDCPLIPNHISARLSALDLQMVYAIPEGGNWKDIPETIPSKRLDNIRQSFKRGEGSRSTYYGRLRGNMPSYTINTYFNRPGNGCHIHPFQNRVLSQREAARLQSFPDSFQFLGSQTSINKQIGNAVPPLLAFHIAQSLGKPGVFVDLFSGAGGLGLGFKWAGWKPLVANDIEPHFLKTYCMNVHDSAVLGSISDDEIRQVLVSTAKALLENEGDVPFWILGGPPCQGFSTAGHRRTMQDERNHLFWDYCKVLEELRPDGFVFENVTGLLNMDGGCVFEMVKEAFINLMPRVEGWLLSADEHAIPQRRKRVVLVGCTDNTVTIAPPMKLTNCHASGDLFSANEQAISVSEAITDLPQLTPGQDGSSMPYASHPQTTYQAFMRGQISPEEYLCSVRERRRQLQNL